MKGTVCTNDFSPSPMCFIGKLNFKCNYIFFYFTLILASSPPIHVRKQ